MNGHCALSQLVKAPDSNVSISFLPHFSHLCFLVYQYTNCIWEGRKGCISSFFWQPASVPREKKIKENKKPIRPVCCSEWFLLISEGCDVEGRVSSSPQLGLLRDIRHGGWAMSWEGKNASGLFANELQEQFRQKLDCGSLFSKAKPPLPQMQHSRVLRASSSSWDSSPGGKHSCCRM